MISKKYYSDANIPVSHLNALSNPIPVFATVLNIAHLLFFILPKPIFSDISISDKAPSKSCLLANIAILIKIILSHLN